MTLKIELPNNYFYNKMTSILGDFFHLFLFPTLLCFASYLPGLAFCSKIPVVFSGVASLISRSGCFRVAFIQFIGLSCCTLALIMMFHSLVGSSLQLADWKSQLQPILLCIVHVLVNKAILPRKPNPSEQKYPLQHQQYQHQLNKD